MKRILAGWFVLGLAANAASIWVEGEAPKTSQVLKQGWYDGVKKDLLSGGNWLSHYGPKPGDASYEVKVAQAGAYVIWARLNPVASKPQWALDGAALAPVDLKEARGQQNLAPDGKPDHRFIAWVKLGSATLTAGTHSLAFHWEGGAANSGALDCFVLTNDGFLPQGAMKPGEGQSAGGPADWFPLLADDDAFSPQSIIDMSRRIPAPAGQFGFLKPVGQDLRFEKGTAPAKFWGVGASFTPGKYTRPQLTQRAKYLRKYGINIVRQHTVWDDFATQGKLDPRKLDEYDWWFAELKKNGIYSDWSIFYHWMLRRDAGYPLFDDLEGTGDLRDTYGVITSAPALWAMRNQVVAELLTHKNPYTGLRYADDPALAIVEMQNEDSIFFYNPLSVLAEAAPKKWAAHAKQLRQGFAAWVKARYQTDEALQKAWGTLRPGDSVKAGELRLITPWEMDGKGLRGAFAGQEKRTGDFIEFLAGMQRAEFEGSEKVIRAAGYRAVSMTTAWQVGGSATDAANIWTDTVGGMIDRHNYFGGGEGGHGIKEGKVNNASHLSTPGGGIISVGMKQVESKPFCLTEWTQSPPNQWKVESAPIVAFYGQGLQGWDATFHFAQSGTKLGDGWPGMSSYATDTPAYIGQFPALSLAILRGDIAEGALVAARRLTKADLFTGKDPLKQDATKGGYDAKTLTVESGGTPLEALAIGRVTVDFAGGKSVSADLSKYWDQAHQVVASTTGQLTWRYGQQSITVDTPRTKGFIGRTVPAGADGSRSRLSDGTTVSVQTPFVSLLLTSLDDQPIAQSRHVLVTALAQDKQTGSRYNADGTRLESVGTAPLLLEPVQASIKIAGARPAAVVPCDAYGVPMPGRSVPVAADGTFEINGTYRAFYYEVKR